MKAIVATDRAAGTAGMKLVERPEPQGAALASLSGASPEVAADAQTYAELEARVLAGGMEGIALRYGLYYGESPVPEKVILGLAGKCEPPTWTEAHGLTIVSEGAEDDLRKAGERGARTGSSWAWSSSLGSPRQSRYATMIARCLRLRLRCAGTGRRAG